MTITMNDFPLMVAIVVFAFILIAILIKPDSIMIIVDPIRRRLMLFLEKKSSTGEKVSEEKNKGAEREANSTESKS